MTLNNLFINNISIFFIPDFTCTVFTLFLFIWYLNNKYLRYSVLVLNFTYLYLILLLQYFFLYLYSTNDVNAYYFNSFILYPDIILFKFLISFLVFIFFIIHSRELIQKPFLLASNRNYGLYFFLINLSVMSLLLLVSSNTFVFMYLSLELFSLSSCILISTTTTRSKELLWSLYYFIIGTIASCIFLLGLVYLYKVTGTLSIQKLSLLCSFVRYSSDYNFSLFGSLILILVGVVIKGGLAPFHFWVVELYSRLPYFTLFYFLIFSKFFCVIFFWKIVKTFCCFNLYISYFFIVIGLCNIFFGTLLAINQVHLKKFLICSSITNVGYLVLLLPFSTDCFFILYVYVLIYLLTMLAIYAVLSSPYSLSIKPTNTDLLHKVHDQRLEYITDLVFLSFSKKLYLTFFLFSLMGIPPLAGFWVKILLMYHFITFKYFLIVVIIQVLNVMSLVYYVNLCKFICFDNPLINYQIYFWLTKVYNSSCVFSRLSKGKDKKNILLFLSLYNKMSISNKHVKISRTTHQYDFLIEILQALFFVLILFFSVYMIFFI